MGTSLTSARTMQSLLLIMQKKRLGYGNSRSAATTLREETTSSRASPQWTRERAWSALEERLPSPLVAITVIVELGVIAAFAAFVQMHGASAPMMFLVMPIPLAAALIVTTVVHDREAQLAPAGRRK